MIFLIGLSASVLFFREGVKKLFRTLPNLPMKLNGSILQTGNQALFAKFLQVAGPRSTLLRHRPAHQVVGFGTAGAQPDGTSSTAPIRRRSADLICSGGADSLQGVFTSIPPHPRQLRHSGNAIPAPLDAPGFN